MKQFLIVIISLLATAPGFIPGLSSPLFAQNLAAPSLPKIVSLDYCADQYVLSLAGRDQILALSKEAHDIHSFYRDRAQGLATTGNSAEEILSLSPDLVVRTWGGNTILPILHRGKIDHVSAVYGSDLETVYKNMRLIGAKMAQDQKAQSHIIQAKTRAHRLKTAPKTSLKALYLTPGGITAGQQTFVDNIIRMAGFEPLAESMKIIGWQNLPLEQMMLDPPDLIIGSFFDLPTAQSPWSLSRHGRIAKMMQDIPTILLPGRYLACNGLFALDAAEYIRERAAILGLIKLLQPLKRE